MKNIFKLLRNSIKYRQHLFPSFRTTRYNHTFFQQIYQSTYNNTTKQIILTSRNVSSLIPYYISKDRSTTLFTNENFITLLYANPLSSINITHPFIS